MAWLEILLISFGVSIDAFAVSTSGSLCKPFLPRRIQALNAALFFGFFQFMMPVIGFWAAGFVTGLFQSLNSLIAAILLGAVGGKMIFDAIKDDDGKVECKVDTDFFALKNLFLPAIATSIDAMAVGAGLAFAAKPLWLTAVSMGVVTGIVSACGVLLGSSLRHKVNQKYLTIAGGTAIILIGIKALAATFFN